MKSLAPFLLLLFNSFTICGQNYIPLQYEDHHLYNPSETNHYLFVVDRSPTDSHVISLYSLFSTQGDVTANLSLSETPEWYEFDPGRSAIFRVHDPVDLNTLHAIKVNNTQPSNYFTFRYSGGVVGCELRLPEPLDSVSVNNSYVIINTDPERKLLCLLLMDTDGGLLFERYIYYRGTVHPTSFRNNLEVGRHRIAGAMNESLYLLDFNFNDSTQVISESETFTLYHPENGIYLHTIHTNGSEYSGELTHNGDAHILASQALNNSVFRIFGIRSGTTIDLDPTQNEYLYTTAEGDYELILVKYNESGNVNWVNSLARIESSHFIPGYYHAKLVADEVGRVAAAFYFSGGNVDLIGSSFYVKGTEGYTDFETITDNNIQNDSPVYAHSFDSESGSSTSLYSLRNNAISPGLFPSHSSHVVRVRPFDNNRFSLRTSMPNGIAVDWQYIRHFPDSVELATSSTFSQNYQGHYFILPYSGNQTEVDQYTLDYDVTPPFNSYAELGICKTVNNQVLVGGSAEGLFDFAFYPDEFLNVNADFIGGVGLLLRTMDFTTHTQESLSTNLKVFPNPTTAQITIDRSQDTEAAFKIYDSTGKVMMEGDFNHQQKTIQVEHFPNGIYFIHVESHGDAAIKKFIKTR